MERTLEYQITEAEQSFTVKQYLKSRGYSTQSLIQLKKRPECVVVNNTPVYMNHRLNARDLLTVRIIEEASSEKILPVQLPLDIVYEDEDLIIVNKPAGMPIHPSKNNYDNSVANALAWYYKQQGIPFVFRCVNRLDRDTSGLTIIARHYVSAGMLSHMLTSKAAPKELLTAGGAPGKLSMSGEAPEETADRRIISGTYRTFKGIRRQYLAIVRGSVNPPSGTVTAPLSRKPGSVIERIVDFENGEHAVTHYRVIEEKNGHSLVSLELETGRTHQIRIHMKYLGYPLIGDYLYNPDMEYIERQALHSHRLAFIHPVTGKAMEFTAPLPEDMKRVFLSS